MSDDTGDFRLRGLEIERELAEMKRRYLVDGVHGDIQQRATLEAELAQIAILRHKARIADAEAKAAAQEVKAQRFMALLCKKVEDAGMASRIKEAQAESLDYIKEQGLLRSYRISAKRAAIGGQA